MCGNGCRAMQRRRLSLPILEPNQPGITRFVERGKDHLIQFISENRATKFSAKETTTPKSPSADSLTKKRSRLVLSSLTAVQKEGQVKDT